MPATVSRRSFFNLLKPVPSTSGGLAKGRRNFSPLSDPLAPFVPGANTPWDEFRTGHLLRRTMMAPTWADIEALVALGDPGKAVDLLLSTTSTPAVPAAGNDKTENPYPLALPAQYPIFGQWESDAAALRAWWANLQFTASSSIQEKMTAFWSGHFTTQFDLGGMQYVIAPLLYRQNNLFRTFGNIPNGPQNGPLGNFKDLVKSVTLDGAMLVYLGGNQNTAGAPNENYARELMELFTCGLGGGYTEADIHAAARILTGWRVMQYTDDPGLHGIFNPWFKSSDHDTGDKTYFETDFPAVGVGTNTEFNSQNEINRTIDVLFTNTADSTATFICTKLYKFFVYSDPDTTTDSTEQSVIAAMATLFQSGNWEIKPVVSALLKSEHFFDNLNIGCQIKTPAEYVIGMARQLAPAYAIDGNMTAIDEQFFQPPNVSGWPGYHDWITTNTYPTRGTEASAAIQLMDDNAAIAFVEQFPNYTDVNALSTAIGQLLLPRPLSSARATAFAQKLAGTTQTYEWGSILSNSPTTAAANIRDLLNYIVSLPDFELC
ncbi:MAG: DUF1800 family protein [Candidatus Kapaibacterium sp.]